MGMLAGAGWGQSILSVSIPDAATVGKIGDVVTATLVLDGTFTPGDQSPYVVTGSVAGYALSTPATYVDDTHLTVTFTVAAGADYAVLAAIPVVSLQVTNTLSEATAAFTGSLDALTNYSIDATRPTLSSVSIASNDTRSANFATQGKDITVSFTSSEDLAGTPTVTINGAGAAVSGGPTNWTATSTLGVSALSSGGAITFSISASDLYGNALAAPATALTTGTPGVAFNTLTPVASADPSLSGS